MTIITETRWKCDYCGAVSPPLEEGRETARGWFTDPRLYDEQFMARIGAPIYHFCCENHREDWVAARNDYLSEPAS